MSTSYILGSFRLDDDAGILLHEGEPAPVGQRAVALLTELISRPGTLVSKEVLVEAAWPGLFVEESNLSVQIGALRRAFAAEPGAERWIETLPRRGYRYVGPVSRVASALQGADQTGAPTLYGIPSVAVVPFRAIEGASVPEYFASGLIEEIVCMLAGLREVTVLSRGSTMKFHDKEIDPRELGRELGVRYIVSGAAFGRAGKLRVIAELTDATTGSVLWSQSFGADESSLFDAQDEIVAQLVHSLTPHVREAELHRVRAQRPNDMPAYHLVLYQCHIKVT